MSDARTSSPRPSSTSAPDYGIDAPDVIRNLFLCGAAGLVIWGTAALHWWSGVLTIPSEAHPVVRIGLSGTGLGCMIVFTGTAAAMLYYSKTGKIRGRERLLNELQWTGSESVLDIGCGRGLMLIGAARRVPRGKATGIDLWRAEDLTGNRPDATVENARREGVAERVVVETADMRTLPFADASFDTIVSCAAIHNLPTSKDREQAVREIARVLRPGGQVLINDIRNLRDYTATLGAHGCPDCTRVSAWWTAPLGAVITWGSLRPGTIVARKTTT